MDPEYWLTHRKCRTCGKPKTFDEYYQNRKSCKECIIDKIQARHKEDHSLGVKTIKCIKCCLVRDISFFKFSKPKNLYKDICKVCKNKISFNEQRYMQLEQFFKQILSSASPEDIQIIKDIIVKI